MIQYLRLNTVHIIQTALLIFILPLGYLLYSISFAGSFPALMKSRDLLIISSGALLVTTLINAAAYYLQARFNLNNHGNHRAGKSLTQIKTFKAIAIITVLIFATGAAMMTFEHSRNAGTGVLTSAGIICIIAGVTSKKSFCLIRDGIRLALTRQFRVDDFVIIEGEFGRIEEIQLTYIVVQLWDERRMILPVTLFRDKSVKNITRSGSGTVEDIDYKVNRLQPVLPQFPTRDLSHSQAENRNEALKAN